MNAEHAESLVLNVICSRQACTLSMSQGVMEWHVHNCMTVLMLAAVGQQRHVLLQLDMEGLYELEGSAPVQLLQKALSDQATPTGPDPSRDSMAGVVWTPSMRRMYTLTDRYVMSLLVRCCSTWPCMIATLLLPMLVATVHTFCPFSVVPLEQKQTAHHSSLHHSGAHPSDPVQYDGMYAVPMKVQPC